MLEDHQVRLQNYKGSRSMEPLVPSRLRNRDVCEHMYSFLSAPFETYQTRNHGKDYVQSLCYCRAKPRSCTQMISYFEVSLIVLGITFKTSMAYVDVEVQFGARS